MDADEREIVHFLQTWGTTFVNGKEIARRASTKKRFGEDPDWAKPVLMRLVEKGVLENDASGRFRMVAEKHDKSKRWVSPDINKILEEGGVESSATPIPIEED
ncbi:MAG TPA: hypothetical protein VK815_18970 [Candidatus Acidoferrales bacterium]|jgi:hypothetical protein|nr:hypothetical protein [Candidatus Acidoferrales bacterium]